MHSGAKIRVKRRLKRKAENECVFTQSINTAPLATLFGSNQKRIGRHLEAPLAGLYLLLLEAVSACTVEVRL